MSVKLLVADDEEVIRRGVAKYIRLHTDRFDKIYEAENGQEAIDLLLKYQPDILLLDVQMPLKNGLDVMKEAQRAAEMKFQTAPSQPQPQVPPRYGG